MQRKQILKINFLITVLLLIICNVSIAEDKEWSPKAKHAVGFSAGWISGNGISYRYYISDYFLQGTFFGVVSDNGKNVYINGALSAGKYLHKLKASGIMPPLGLKVMAGADILLDRQNEIRGSTLSGGETERTFWSNKSFYGGGVGIDIGNPGHAGLSLWIAVNYVFAFNGVTSPDFDWFGARPSAGIIYSW